MAKTRLNADKRNVLLKLADDLVQFDTDLVARERGIYATLIENVHDWANTIWPEEDLVVLRHHGLTQVHNNITTSLPTRTWDRIHGGRHMYRLLEIPLGDRPIEIAKLLEPMQDVLSPGMVAEAAAWQSAVHELHEERRGRLDAYRVLIKTSYAYEDVLEIWPEAEQAREKFGIRMLPSALTETLLDTLRADMATRQQTAEA